MEIEEVGILFGVFLVEHGSCVVPQIRTILNYCVNLFLRGHGFHGNFFSSLVIGVKTANFSEYPELDS